jgi:hypothetical protein
MSHDDSLDWRARAEEMRTLAEQISGEISKQVMRGMADDYERFAQMVEDRPNRFLGITPVVPLEVSRFAGRKTFLPARSRTSDLEIPSFLKRGPATEHEVDEESSKIPV